MDLYEEKEHVISSDEYSEDDDDDDALMNSAIRAQSKIKCHLTLDESVLQEKPKWRIDQKQKQLSSLIRRNKISIIYKNKSIKWLNSKKQRERYKGHFRNEQDMRNKSKQAERTHGNESRLTSNKESSIVDTNNVVSLDDDDGEDEEDEDDDDDDDDDDEDDGDDDDNDVDHDARDSSDMSVEESLKSKLSQSNIGREENVVTKSKTNADNTTTKTQENQQSKGTSQSSQTELPEKRARSCSPLVKENRGEHVHSEKRFKADSPQFYKKINEMFPKFDEIAINHIEYITHNSLTATEDKMKSIFNEIKTLDDILHTKEMEWNRILHLKMIKEELYSRLSRKKHILEMNETLTKTRSQNTLLELKELELYLSEKSSTSQPINSSYSSIQQIIENRANMKAEDLERERNNTSRLHSLLVSRNMLPGIESAENKLCGNGEVNVKCNDAIFKANVESYQLLENRNLLHRGRQGEFKDVKSIIADFRQKNPDILPRVGKRIKSSDPISLFNNYSISLFDKKSNPHSQYLHFTKDHKPDFYPLRNSVEDISITPAASTKQEFAFAHTMNSHYNACVDDSNNKGNVKRNLNLSSPKNIQYPYCQECKIHESRFVCAGCGNQWYCSKKCQISAWDKHSEICTD